MTRYLQFILETWMQTVERTCIRLGLTQNDVKQYCQLITPRGSWRTDLDLPANQAEWVILEELYFKDILIAQLSVSGLNFAFAGRISFEDTDLCSN